MRTSATSGPLFSLYLSIVVLLVVLVSVSDKAHARPQERSSINRRRNLNNNDGFVRKASLCFMVGHTCYGGHGKRFDAAMQRNTLQESINQNFQGSEVPSANDELFYALPNDGFRERSQRSFRRTRKDAQQFDVNPLSSLVDQWIASHRRPRRTETDITNK
ncbi:PREDICTED: uncharacterized protein LOC105456987 isoform X1 [Wasmannia auropunctata]|uniref:uncharacterized protein LOC105456987 isoform X1 n=1 Tax=Wasmannia auropunctata TaxID=64793 RepID=UPI0005EFDC4F|nr:PREDICTED: uncharacterized protein LOC105456987 isoform X1 [Wasmannia auropunctata]